MIRSQYVKILYLFFFQQLSVGDLFCALWLHKHQVRIVTLRPRHVTLKPWSVAANSYFDTNSTEICSNFSLVEGLAPNRCQAIIWINDGIDGWYTSLSLSGVQWHNSPGTTGHQQTPPKHHPTWLLVIHRAGHLTTWRPKKTIKIILVLCEAKPDRENGNCFA